MAVRNIGLKIRDKIVASNYLRSNSRVARYTYELREVSNECVLVKRIVTVWKFPASEEVLGAELRHNMLEMPWNKMPGKLGSIYLRLLYRKHCTHAKMIQRGGSPGENPNPTARNIHGLSHLWFGHLNRENSSGAPMRLLVRQGDKTTTSQAYSMQGEGEGELIVIEELRGLSAMAWLNPDCTEQQVRSMLGVDDSNTTDVYELPDIKRKKKICEHWNDENEISLGELMFSKLNETCFPSAGNNLLELYVNMDAEVICYIGNKTSIAYIRGDNGISVNLPKGTYAIRRVTTGA